MPSHITCKRRFWMSPDTQPVRFERQGPVANIIMQGRHGNALNADLLEGLNAAFSRASEDEEVGGVLLTSGGKLFSPGLDLQELLPLDRPEMDRFMGLFGDTIFNIYTHPKPVVAGISGHAVAGGCVLALACDFRLLKEDALIGLNEVKVGVPLPYAVVQLLRETVHRPALPEIALIGRNYSNDAALAAGLTHEIVPGAGFSARCHEYAEELCSRDATALARTKSYLGEATVNRILARDAELRAEFLDCWFSDSTKSRIEQVVQGLKKRA
jgi:3,2-trans-enoyl-CoA isomerase